MTCTTSPPHTHKRGDTFDLSGPVTVTEAGEPLPDLTGWAGAAQLRTPGDVLVADLQFEWLNAAQGLCRLMAADTSAWPIGPAQLDIQLTSPAGAVVSTDTAQLRIVKDVTRHA